MASFFLFAQEGPKDKVTITNEYIAKLIETERIALEPVLPAKDTSTVKQTYRLPLVTINVEYPPPKIRPLAMKSTKLPESYNGHLKLGAGMPFSFYGDAAYHTLIDKTLDLRFEAGHHSANFKKVENQRFAKNYIGGAATWFHENGFAVEGTGRYQSDKNYFYGYNFLEDSTDIKDIDAKDVLQRWSLLKLGTKIYNSAPTVGDIDYSAGIDFYFLADHYASAERGFDLRLQGTKWINELHAFDLAIRTDFTNFEDTLTKSLNNFYLRPAFTYHGGSFKAKIGGNLVSSNDKYYLFPDALLTVNIIGNQVVAFAGAEGSLEKNNFLSLSRYNPYIVSEINLVNTKYTDYFGGVQGVLKALEYSGKISYKKADNLAMFLPVDDREYPVRKRFDILYDTVTIFNISGSVSLDLFKGLNITGLISQSVYSPKNEEKAWHLPALEVNGTVTYLTMDNKLKLIGELFVENGVPYKGKDGNAQNLNGLFDVSAGADFAIAKNFDLFVKINNLANNKRKRWQYYPTYGLNVLGGLTVKF